MGIERIQCDVLIIGAGVLGSSVAMALGKLGVGPVRVIDFDLEGHLSSSELNAGGVRATMTHPLNVELSKRSIEYFKRVKDEVGYRACGYLWLHPADRMESVRESLIMQRDLGWEVETLTPSQITERVPFIDKLDGIDTGVFAPNDGLLNPNLLKNHYRDQARKFGVQFDDRVWVERVDGGHILAKRFPRDLSEENRKAILESPGTGSDHGLKTVPIQYECRQVVNCAGAWAGELSKLFGEESYTTPIRRQISIFDCRDVDLTPYGMIVDTSGVYFHPEAGNGLAGMAAPNDPSTFTYNYDGVEFFQEQIWSHLHERSTFFERLKHLTGWAGLYEVSPDHSGIIGRVGESFGPRGFELFEAHSFSGHGVMQSYAAGQLLAELMVHGKYETLDISRLNRSRFKTNSFVTEGFVI